MDSLVIVDCQYDFIDGSLACSGSHEAVAYLINFINRHEMEVLYTSDWHSPANRSFKVNGGIWPIHCVAGEKGSALDRHFFADIIDVKNRPNEENIFHKGMDDIVEEYSAFHGINKKGIPLGTMVTDHVYVGGIASEYCVKETVFELLKAGHKVMLLVKGLGYVDYNGHLAAIKSLAWKFWSDEGRNFAGYRRV